MSNTTNTLSTIDTMESKQKQMRKFHQTRKPFISNKYNTSKSENSLVVANTLITNTLITKPPIFRAATNHRTLSCIKMIQESTNWKFVLSDSDPYIILDCLEALMFCIGAERIIGFNDKWIKGKKLQVTTFEMKKKTLTDTQKSLLHWKNVHSHYYKSALSFVSSFASQIDLWFRKWLRHTITDIAKLRFLPFVLEKYQIELKHLPHTMNFLNQAATGSLSYINLQQMLKNVYVHEPQGIRYIAYLIPTNSIMCRTPINHIIEIHQLWKHNLPIIMLGLEDAWYKGVWGSKRHQINIMIDNYNNDSSIIISDSLRNDATISFKTYINFIKIFNHYYNELVLRYEKEISSAFRRLLSENNMMYDLLFPIPKRRRVNKSKIVMNKALLSYPNITSNQSTDSLVPNMNSNTSIYEPVILSSILSNPSDESIRKTDTLSVTSTTEQKKSVVDLLWNTFTRAIAVWGEKTITDISNDDFNILLNPTFNVSLLQESKHTRAKSYSDNSEYDKM